MIFFLFYEFIYFSFILFHISYVWWCRRCVCVSPVCPCSDHTEGRREGMKTEEKQQSCLQQPPSSTPFGEDSRSHYNEGCQHDQAESWHIERCVAFKEQESSSSVVVSVFQEFTVWAKSVFIHQCNTFGRELTELAAGGIPGIGLVIVIISTEKYFVNIV